MELIDFTKAINNAQLFKPTGNNKKKLKIIYNNEEYIIKTSKYTIEQDKENKYKMIELYNTISEYLGCKIYDSLNIPAQKTLLGYYQYKNKKQMIIACKNFNIDDSFLPFGIFFNKERQQDNNKLQSLEIKNIIKKIEEQNIYDSQKIKKRFWDMFIIDAFIDNPDRTSGNWGFIKDKKTNTIINFCPIFDCEQNIFLEILLKNKKQLLNNQNKINFLAISPFKKSYLIYDNKVINYFNFISSLENEDCNEALKRIVPKIDIEKIIQIINDLPLEKIQKNFLITILQKRKELLNLVLIKLNERENQ